MKWTVKNIVIQVTAADRQDYICDKTAGLKHSNKKRDNFIFKLNHHKLNLRNNEALNSVYSLYI